MVFILWGRAARDKKRLIDLKRNFVVESAHPSPLSAYRGVFCTLPCSKTIQCLEMTGQAPINWQLPATVVLL